jgi:hypothetical protein
MVDLLTLQATQGVQAPQGAQGALQGTQAQISLRTGSSERQGGIQGIGGSSMMDQLGMELPLDADAAFLAGQWEIPQKSTDDGEQIGV